MKKSMTKKEYFELINEISKQFEYRNRYSDKRKVKGYRTKFDMCTNQSVIDYQVVRLNQKYGDKITAYKHQHRVYNYKCLCIKPNEKISDVVYPVPAWYKKTY